MEEKIFHTSYGASLSIDEVVEEIVSFMMQKPDYSYSITVGSDSEIFENKEADFVTAVVVHRIGNGGRFFWTKQFFGKFYNLHDRIIREVLCSIEIANLLINRLNTKLRELNNRKLQWHFEIHVDVGANGPTKSLVQEVVGIVKAHNFEARTKPESYAASKVADFYV